MNNFEFLKAYAALQKDIMFDELRNLDFGLLCYNKLDPSPFWNNVLVERQLNFDEVETVEEQLSELDRKPALFFENTRESEFFSEALKKSGYSQAAEDSLMFHYGQNIPEVRFEQIKKVMTTDDLNVFMTIFNECYRADDPLNPYGELGEYVDTARVAWERHHQTNRLEYFMAYKNDEPVAVAALSNFKGIGYLSNIGSLLSVRGQGFGKSITNYCIAQSVKNGNTTHCLATEEGTNPNSFYQALGFKTKFTAKLMAKE